MFQSTNTHTRSRTHAQRRSLGEVKTSLRYGFLVGRYKFRISRFAHSHTLSQLRILTLISHSITHVASHTYAHAHTQRRSLGEVKFSLRYGFLVGRYKLEFYFFELVVLSRKLLVALCMAFLTDSPYIKAGVAVIGECVCNTHVHVHLHTHV